MKGFGIEIKNNLLEPKHIDKMGVSVWLYMWFIDKITVVTPENLGLVLGGKPIIYEEVEKELGIPERTYWRWLKLLKKNGYVLVTRTPKGNIFKVTKAYKNFKKQSAKSGTSLPNQTAKSGSSDMPKVAVPSAKSGSSNKTVTDDSNSKTITTVANATGGKPPSEKVDKRNPIIQELWEFGLTQGLSNTKQNLNRYAIKRLLNSESMKNPGQKKTAEELKGAVEFSQKIRQEQYAPQINNWMDLEEKYLKLRDFVGRKMKTQVKTQEKHLVL